MTTSTPTAYAVSPDSGEHWAASGAWPVADGVHRIPLPLPMDGLKAVNVYVVEASDGLVLVDGGWAIPETRELLDRCLRSIGSGFGDIKRFLVTHVHRDHFTMATVLGHELGIEVSLGLDEKPALDLLNELLAGDDEAGINPFSKVLKSAGAVDVAEAWADGPGGGMPPAEWWAYPDTWLDGDHPIDLGPRTLDAVHTPGHTPGHFVFADRAAALLFAGDHVLPTITPSIGFTMPETPLPLADFLSSLAKVRALPDLEVLPAHGPVAPSSHARVDELVAHHDHRLELCLAAVGAGPATAQDVARQLPWTRHERAYDGLDVFNQGMAAMETKAHLELLVARDQLSRTVGGDGVVTFAPHAG